jgi:hypothetical protein
VAATALVLCGLLGACAASDPYDEPTRISVFTDMSTTLARYLYVPAPYSLSILQAGIPAEKQLIDQNKKVKTLIGNGLGDVDVRLVLLEADVVATLQVAVFSALAPEGAAAQLVAGQRESIGNDPVDTAVADRTVQLFTTPTGVIVVWNPGRVVATFTGSDRAAVLELVGRYFAVVS